MGLKPARQGRHKYIVLPPAISKDERRTIRQNHVKARGDGSVSRICTGPIGYFSRKVLEVVVPIRAVDVKDLYVLRTLRVDPLRGSGVIAGNVSLTKQRKGPC